MADQEPTELSRDLGLFTITMVGVGAMIGAGIFVLTGIATATLLCRETYIWFSAKYKGRDIETDL